MADVPAHITGTVWKIEVTIGQAVSLGETLVILESMKMQLPVQSNLDGKVANIRVSPGDFVNEGDPILTLE